MCGSPYALEHLFARRCWRYYINELTEVGRYIYSFIKRVRKMARITAARNKPETLVKIAPDVGKYKKAW